MHPTLRRIAGVLGMLLGSAGVFALVYSMNELSSPPRPDAARVANDFKVEKPPRKQQPDRPHKREKPRESPQTARRAPTPNITTALSGSSFGLPQVHTADLIGTDQLLAGADTNKRLVMTEESVDSLPRPRSRMSPEYPSKARQRGIEGHVLLKLKVTEHGEVEQVRVIEAEPAGVFEDVAIAAVRQWKFEPAKYKGTPVAISVSQRIPFRLN